MLRLAVLISAALALLAITLVGLFVVLPLLIVGGIGLHFYLRHRLRQARRHPADGVIDAEYTVVDHR
jgi:Flp pilus assembly protein TadB